MTQSCLWIADSAVILDASVNCLQVFLFCFYFTPKYKSLFLQVINHHTSSMSSLNSQESSNDICKLTDKQQAEYRDAYREYIAQMAQLDMSGSVGERPVQPHPGQFLQASSSEDKGVGGQPQSNSAFDYGITKGRTSPLSD